MCLRLERFTRATFPDRHSDASGTQGSGSRRPVLALRTLAACHPESPGARETQRGRCQRRCSLLREATPVPEEAGRDAPNVQHGGDGTAAAAGDRVSVARLQHVTRAT